MEIRFVKDIYHPIDELKRLKYQLIEDIQYWDNLKIDETVKFLTTISLPPWMITTSSLSGTPSASKPPKYVQLVARPQLNPVPGFDVKKEALTLKNKSIKIVKVVNFFIVKVIIVNNSTASINIKKNYNKAK